MLSTAEIARRFRIRQADLNLGVREVARRAGISPATFSRLRHGQHRGHPLTLRAICDVLELDPEGFEPRSEAGRAA